MNERWAGLNPPYATIVADPPWRYDNTRGTQTRAKRGRGAVTAAGNYSTLSRMDITALPVASLAADQAHLYLWVTNPLLHQDPWQVMEAWGFKYVTMITWVKTGPPGLGFSFRGHTEHALFGIRGGLRIAAPDRQSNVVTAPRRRHSEKPLGFYDLVERVSPAPRVELFARAPRLGWDHWGFGYEQERVS